MKEHANIVRWIDTLGEVAGRTKLQKIGYIAQVFGFDVDEKYAFHLYGPYSAELTARIEELCESAFLQEETKVRGASVQYTYRVTEEGRAFAEVFTEASSIPEDVLRALNEKSSRFLEIAATLLYFDDLPKEERKEKVSVVKKRLDIQEEEWTEAFAWIDAWKMKYQSA